MVIKEIGSEFLIHSDKINISDDQINFPFSSLHSSQFVSGRTALDFIIKDLNYYVKIKTVLLPSYCCETMIIPFVENKINVYFYDAVLDSKGANVFYDKCTNSDSIIVMNYFGFQSPAIEKFIDELTDRNIVVIKDATQSLFSETSYDFRADYVFASLRKWMGVPDGALLVKRDGDFKVPLSQNENKDFVSLRLEAMRLKEDYINNRQGAKEDYLKKFAEASQLLAKDYAGYKMSDYTMNLLQKIDKNTIIKKRRENAAFLISNLSDCKGIHLIFNVVKQNDVPLFVPILVKNSLRDKLRQYLIEKEIYCPVHWPLSNWHNISEESKQIYHQELSLICDQRYDLSDMVRIVNEVKNFFNKN